MKENKRLHHANSQHHGNCLNHGLDRLKDFTDLKSGQLKNQWNLSNPSKSVIQTTIAENYKEVV